MSSLYDFLLPSNTVLEENIWGQCPGGIDNAPQTEASAEDGRIEAAKGRGMGRSPPQPTKEV